MQNEIPSHSDYFRSTSQPQPESEQLFQNLPQSEKKAGEPQLLGEIYREAQEVVKSLRFLEDL